jgi:uncharacterized phage-like protein YoqJ
MKKIEGYILTEKELGCLGETMVELSHLVYERIYNKYVFDHTEVAVIIRDAAINFDNKGNFWNSKNSDYYTELCNYADELVLNIKKEYES